MDTSVFTDAELASWARARIAADSTALLTLLRGAGVADLGDEFDTALNYEVGLILFRGENVIYALGPPRDVVGQTDEGRELLWQDGEQVYDLDNPGA